MPRASAARTLTEDQRGWQQVRRYLQDHRHELTSAAASTYPEVPKVAGTPLLTAPAWTPAGPVPLPSIALSRAPAGEPVALSGLEDASAHLRPVRPDGTRYPSYAATVADLAAPGVFQDRSTYCLRSADLATPGGPALGFGPGSYFTALNVGDACAHELAAHQLGLGEGTPFRDAVGNPCDPTRRPVNVAVSALTLRVDRVTRLASFPLHWRDPAKVGHAGGLYMVTPVGVFQASRDEPAHHDNDFSLWRCLLREFAEELLGEPEDHGSEPIDYAAWPFAATMSQALSDGRIRAHVLGMGVDPLTLATDLLTVVAVDARLYDDLFGRLVHTNDEGQLAEPPVASESGQGRFRFTADVVERLTTIEPMQAAGAALVRLAWQHRDVVTELG